MGTRLAMFAASLGILFLVGFAFVQYTIIGLTLKAVGEPPKLGAALEIIGPILTGMVGAVVAIHLGQPEPKTDPRLESTSSWFRKFIDFLVRIFRRLGATIWPSTNAGRQAVIGTLYFLVYFAFAAWAAVIWIQHSATTPEALSQLVLISLGLGTGIIRSWMTQPQT